MLAELVDGRRQQVAAGVLQVASQPDEVATVSVDRVLGEAAFHQEPVQIAVECPFTLGHPGGPAQRVRSGHFL